MALIIDGGEMNIEYPVTRRHLGSGIVVLFWGEKAGVVIKGNSGTPFGWHSDEWRSCNDTTEWESINIKIKG